MKRKNKSKEYLLLEENRLWAAFFKLALPVIAANLLRSIHDLVDTYFIGQLNNSVDAQAGMSITWPLLGIFVAVRVGLSTAGLAVISHQNGAGERESARQYTGLLVTLSVGLGTFIALLVFFLCPGILHILGAKEGVYDAAYIYLKIRAFEMPFLFLFAAFETARQAKGDMISPVVLSVCSILLNIILTAVFLRVFSLGVFGAALATLIGQAAVTPFCMYYLFFSSEEGTLSWKELKPDREKILCLGKVAVPAAVSQGLSSLGMLIFQAVTLTYGNTVMAAYSIGTKISNMLLIPITAYGGVLAAFVGQNIGAGNEKRAVASYRVSRISAVLFSLAGCVVLLPFRYQVVHLLTNNQEAFKAAAVYLVWVLFTQPLMALFQNYCGLFNGTGNTQYTFRIVSIRLWILRIPLMLFFKFFTNLGEIGIWLSMFLSNFLVLFIAEYLYKRVTFHKKSY